jgi:hypothetical protein
MNVNCASSCRHCRARPGRPAVLLELLHAARSAWRLPVKAEADFLRLVPQVPKLLRPVRSVLNDTCLSLSRSSSLG